MGSDVQVAEPGRLSNSRLSVYDHGLDMILVYFSNKEKEVEALVSFLQLHGSESRSLSILFRRSSALQVLRLQE